MARDWVSTSRFEELLRADESGQVPYQLDHELLKVGLEETGLSWLPKESGLREAIRQSFLGVVRARLDRGGRQSRIAG